MLETPGPLVQARDLTYCHSPQGAALWLYYMPLHTTLSVGPAWHLPGFHWRFLSRGLNSFLGLPLVLQVLCVICAKHMEATSLPFHHLLPHPSLQLQHGVVGGVAGTGLGLLSLLLLCAFRVTSQVFA